MGKLLGLGLQHILLLTVAHEGKHCSNAVSVHLSQPCKPSGVSHACVLVRWGWDQGGGKRRGPNGGGVSDSSVMECKIPASFVCCFITNDSENSHSDHELRNATQLLKSVRYAG